VMAGPQSHHLQLAGRADELAEVSALIQAAAQGQAGALLISGEAGVGKTALARAACSQHESKVDVLWGSCLPLTSLAVPFLPLTTALRQWAADHDEPVPLLQPAAETGSSVGPLEFDSWLAGICRRRPVVLVMDDLHWADQSTLDVLMYVLAGLADRRLAVLATIRSGEVTENHLLRRWLADMRRLPGVRELRLDRLDRAATADQLAGLLGGPPHETLVDQVYARTDGNAYLTTLLARGLPPDARSLPAGLPTELGDAAMRAWRSLSSPAQALTRLIAVAGRPQRSDQLGKLAAQTGVTGDVVPLLREAVDGAVLQVGAPETYWFVHPLLAEVLEAGLLPEERRALHGAFVEALDGYSVSADAIDIERVVDLADHHYRAGHREEAYRWALLGAEAAARAGGAKEMLRLLRRAFDLWPDVPHAEPSRLDLLQHIRQAADQAGAQEEELTAVDDLLALVDRERDPLTAAELLVRRMILRLSTGREFAGLADVREAVRLSAGAPESWQYALSVAEPGEDEMWHDVPSGPARAEEAVQLARACDSKKALTYALTARVMARCMASDGGELTDAQIDSREAQAAAAEVRDFFAYSHATLWAGNCIDVGRRRLDVVRRGREALISLGAPHTYVSWLAADEASELLLLGDWRACAERLRFALGSTPGPMAATITRLHAALLAGWQGRPAEAKAHLARADELFAEQSGFLAFMFDAVRAEVALVAGDTEGAIAAAMAGVEGEGVPPTFCERLLPLAARAAADEAQACRDRGEDPGPAVARLSSLHDRYPEVIAEVGPLWGMYQLQLRAMQALYDGEVLRGQADSRAATAWRVAAQACRDGELAWDEAYARRRAAEALLQDRATRQQGVDELRRAYELATDLEATPLLAELQALARTARVPLTDPRAMPAETATGIPGLTTREREILAHLVAGRTYAEIARDLVISEKTVSVHVSNILHKTGTANRVELAGLARRTGVSASRP
jgi:DNA-binding CsgD family transcriptional regulator